MDMKAMMQNAQQAQAMFLEAYKDKVATGKAGGDLVVATANVKMQITSVTLNPAVLGENIPVLQDLIVSAVNAALMQAQQMIQQGMMEIAQQMGTNR